MVEEAQVDHATLADGERSCIVFWVRHGIRADECHENRINKTTIIKYPFDQPITGNGKVEA